MMEYLFVAFLGLSGMGLAGSWYRARHLSDRDIGAYD